MFLLGYVSEFSPDGKLFALLDTDGKLKIWDTKDSQLIQEYVPNLHLSVPYTCLVWASTKKVSELNAMMRRMCINFTLFDRFERISTMLTTRRCTLLWERVKEV